MEGSSYLLQVMSAEADPWIPGSIAKTVHIAAKLVLSRDGGPGASVILHLDFPHSVSAGVEERR